MNRIVDVLLTRAVGHPVVDIATDISPRASEIIPIFSLLTGLDFQYRNGPPSKVILELPTRRSQDLNPRLMEATIEIIHCPTPPFSNIPRETYLSIRDQISTGLANLLITDP